MATFDATTRPVTFAHMEGETKTIFVVPRSPKFDSVTAGDRFEFDMLGSITVGAIRRYKTLKELLELEGFQNAVPTATTLEEAIDAIRETPDWSEKYEQDAGVIAMRVRTSKRKA